MSASRRESTVNPLRAWLAHLEPSTDSRVKFTWTIAAAVNRATTPGIYRVTVAVCDGRLSATRSFSWTIKKR